MILAAHCRDRDDVPPVMIEVSDDDGYAVVSHKIVESIHGQQLCGTNATVEISQILHGGSVIPPSSRKRCDFYGFTGEPVLFSLRIHHFSDKVRQMPISVQNQGGQKLTLYVDSTDTVEDVLQILQLKVKAPLNQGHALFHADTRMSFHTGTLRYLRHRTLSDFNVQEGASLVWANPYCYPSPFVHHPMEVNVKTMTGKTLFLDAHSSNTSKDIREKIQDKEGIPVDQQRLVYGGVQLIGDSNLFDYGVEEGAMFHLVLRLRGGGTAFGDVSNPDAMKVVNFSKKAESWRRVAPGLCLEGRCNNHACKAYRQMVAINHGFVDFDLARSESMPCPECNTGVIPVTCGFNRCLWRYVGKKQGSRNVLSSAWTETADGYHRFSERQGAEWERLLIQARPKLACLQACIPSGTASIDYTWKECTICLCLPSSDNVQVLQCGHHFHGDCIRSWAKGSLTVACPNCRQISPM